MKAWLSARWERFCRWLLPSETEEQVYDRQW